MTDPGQEPLLSCFQARELLSAREEGATRAQVSIDLGRSATEVEILLPGVRLPDGVEISWTELQRVAETPNSCFRLGDQGLEKLRLYSPRLNRAYSLLPTPAAPTFLISGVLMHRIRGIDPLEDTARKIAALRPRGGVVLDTATGLGYSAIAAARAARTVVTVELDPLVLRLARLNPWSEELYSSDNLHQLVGDTAWVVEHLKEGSFTHILHDPPVGALAGQLYSGAFYTRLASLLRPGGRLFHYLGDPQSAGIRRVERGVRRRLAEAGFRSAVSRPEAFGLIAVRGA